jgi:hypothetical protein
MSNKIEKAMSHYILCNDESIKFFDKHEIKFEIVDNNTTLYKKTISNAYSYLNEKERQKYNKKNPLLLVILSDEDREKMAKIYEEESND